MSRKLSPFYESPENFEEETNDPHGIRKGLLFDQQILLV